MLSAAVISSDPYRAAMVQRLAIDSGLVRVHKLWDRFPYPYDLVRTLNVITPDIIFIDFSNVDEALVCAEEVGARWPKSILIAFGEGADRKGLEDKYGLSAVLSRVPEPEEFLACVTQAVRSGGTNFAGRIIAMTPAKAGCGCSSVVLQTAVHLATEAHMRVLVLEADLRAGALSIFLDAKPEGSTQVALRLAGELEFAHIPQCLYRSCGVDFLLSSRGHGEAPIWYQYYRLLQWAGGEYDCVLVDLPELINPATSEIVIRAERVLLVCTPEIAPLRLAEVRSAELKACGLTDDRLQLVVNRWHRSDLGGEEIERMLKHHICAVIPNDYGAMRSALVDQSPLPPGSAIAAAFQRFSNYLRDPSVPLDPADLFQFDKGGTLRRLLGSLSSR